MNFSVAGLGVGSIWMNMAFSSACSRERGSNRTQQQLILESFYKARTPWSKVDV
jgi:hypothetical protein